MQQVSYRRSFTPLHQLVTANLSMSSAAENRPDHGDLHPNYDFNPELWDIHLQQLTNS